MEKLDVQALSLCNLENVLVKGNRSGHETLIRTTFSPCPGSRRACNSILFLHITTALAIKNRTFTRTVWKNVESKANL